MTWIITVGLSDRAVQVSDRRFTWSDGSLFDDYANKGVCLACVDAHLAFSYTGLAFVGTPEKRVDKWLLDALVDMHAGTTLIGAVIKGLETRVTDVLKATAGDPSTNDLTLIGVGFHANGDCLCVKISNGLNDDGSPADVLRDHCVAHCWISHHNADPARVRLLSVDGYDSAALPVQQRLTALMDGGYFNHASTSVVVQALVEAVRDAADSDDAHGRIGKNCLSVVVPVNGSFESADHGVNGMPMIVHTPPFVTGTVAYGVTTTRLGAVDSPSANVPFDQWTALSVLATFEQRSVRLENVGADDLIDVRLDLNVAPNQDFQGIAKGWSYTSGYMYWLPQLAAGQVERIPFLSFQKFEGTSFDASSQQRENFTVTARLPNGEFGQLRVL